MKDATLSAIKEKLKAFIDALDTANATWLESRRGWSDVALDKHDQAKGTMKEIQSWLLDLVDRGAMPAPAIVPTGEWTWSQWVTDLLDNVNEARRMLFFTREIRPGRKPKPTEPEGMFIEQYRDMYERLPAVRESLRRAYQHLKNVERVAAIEPADPMKEDWSAPATHKQWAKRFETTERSLRKWRADGTLNMQPVKGRRGWWRVDEQDPMYIAWDRKRTSLQE